MRTETKTSRATLPCTPAHAGFFGVRAAGVCLCRCPADEREDMRAV